MTNHNQFVISLKRNFKGLSIDFVYIFIGSFIIPPTFLLLFIFTLPFIVFRAFVTLILSKWYRGHHGYREMIDTGFSTAYAIEYLSSVQDDQPSRNTILTRNVIEGHVPFEICKEKLENGWIKAKDSKNTSKFPKFRSYVDNMMGYCYWRDQPDFDFSSHLHYHKTEKSQDVEEFTCILFEKLFNTPFTPKRSPWDVHIIHGWKQDLPPSENNNELTTGNNQEITIVVIRIHHVLGDAKSLLNLIFQELFGVCMNDNQKQVCGEKVAHQRIPSYLKLKTWLQTYTRLMWDLGCITSFVLWRAKTNTKFHVSSNSKIKYVHYMSSVVSMDTVKNVATKFGVSFSGVLFSSLASALGQVLDKNDSEKFLFAAPRPLPGHPTGKMVNYLTGAAYNLPVNVDMHPKQRLVKCDKIFKMVNKSLFPTHVFPYLIHFLSYHIAPIARFGFKSRQFGASFSNNLGSSVPVSAFDGKYRVLEYSGICGTYDGATGLMILVMSYANKFRFHALANSAALSEHELKQFIERTVAEINELHEMQSFSNDEFITRC